MKKKILLQKIQNKKNKDIIEELEQKIKTLKDSIKKETKICNPNYYTK